jgi:hypothetical protein
MLPREAKGSSFFVMFARPDSRCTPRRCPQGAVQRQWLNDTDATRRWFKAPASTLRAQSRKGASTESDWRASKLLAEQN